MSAHGTAYGAPACVWAMIAAGVLGAALRSAGAEDRGAADRGGAPGRVVITEIMYNPASNERAGETEWVEIANVGDAPVAIRNWHLDDEDRGEWGRFSCILEPGGVAVLVNAKAVDERMFREAWDAARPNAGGEAQGGGGRPETPGEAAESGSGDDSAKGDDENDTGAASSASANAQSNAIARPGRSLVIPVAWGRLSNRPSADDEILRLINDRGETVCMVNFELGGDWPMVDGRGGASIYLMDVRAADASIGRLWSASAPNRDGAWASRTAGAFDAMEVGSPGVIPGGPSGVVSASDHGSTASGDGHSSGDEDGSGGGQREQESDDTIDY